MNSNKKTILPELMLSSKQAADLLEVHESTVKRWCDDHQLKFLITQGGHRRIAFASILEFSKTNKPDLLFAKFAPDEVEVYQASMAALRKSDFSYLIEISMRYCLAHDGSKIRLLFQYLLSLENMKFSRLFDFYFKPFLARLGLMWSEGRVNAAWEHYVSSLLMDALSRVKYKYINPARSLGTNISERIAVVCCADGNWQSFAAVGAELVLRENGWNVFYLGSSVPAADFAVFCKDIKARLAAVSFSAPQTYPDVQRYLDILELSGIDQNLDLHFGASFMVDSFNLHKSSALELHLHNSLQSFELLLPETSAIKGNDNERT